MRKKMIEMLEVGDPLSFDDWVSGEVKTSTGWLKVPPGHGRNTLDVAMRDDTKRLVPFELVHFKRQATSPVGPHFVCEPCGHYWDEHDDTGCQWMVCACWLPGERK